MRIGKLIAVVINAAAVVAVVSVPAASASVVTLCEELGGQWDGRYCHSTVQSERKAVRDIKVAIPAELVDDAVAGPVTRAYLRNLVSNWRTAGEKMAADSFGEENYEIFRHGGTMSAVFHETYHADGPDFNNAYRTFTFDTAAGRQVQLADLTEPGIDPLTAIGPLAQPFLEEALDHAFPPHQPGSYPFVVERWTPDKVFSGGYKAWAVTPDELIVYMPDYPVAHDTPIDFTPGLMQWSMDGGTVQMHIPLGALSPILRPEYGGS
jgi:hypothetical protein